MMYVFSWAWSSPGSAKAAFSAASGAKKQCVAVHIKWPLNTSFGASIVGCASVAGAGSGFTPPHAENKRAAVNPILTCMVRLRSTGFTKAMQRSAVARILWNRGMGMAKSVSVACIISITAPRFKRGGNFVASFLHFCCRWRENRLRLLVDKGLLCDTPTRAAEIGPSSRLWALRRDRQTP